LDVRGREKYILRQRERGREREPAKQQREEETHNKTQHT